MLCGGTTEIKEATEEIQALIEQVRADVETKVGQSLPHFKAINFKSQLVNGTNYFVKVQVGDNEYYHVRIHQELPHAGSKVTFHSHEAGKSKNDDVVYF